MLPKPGAADSKPLTVAEEADLWQQWRKTKAPRARDRIVLSVLGYAVAEANGVHTKAPKDDLVQAGMIGALKAFDKFDETRGTRFGTYAMYWIRAEIWQLAGVERTGVSGTAVRGKGPETAKKRVHTVPLSLYEEDPDVHVGIPIVPEALQAPERTDDEDLNAADEVVQLRKLLDVAGLTTNERYVITQRWLTPLPRSARKTRDTKAGVRALSEVAKPLGLSRERVRQIEAAALRKLRRAAERST